MKAKNKDSNEAKSNFENKVDHLANLSPPVANHDGGGCAGLEGIAKEGGALHQGSLVWGEGFK